jgi:PhzF family phenazine biosynthesis protein
MMRIPLYQIDAFAERPFEGNPAAVCPLASWLPDAILQAIAEENHLSETAFFVPEGGAWTLRWFTPEREVDLCGHATLASAYVLFAGEYAGRNEVRFLSRSGELRVQRDGKVLTLDFPADKGEPCDPPALLADALGVVPLECLRASDYLAVLEDERQVRDLRPDFRRLRDLDGRGLIVTAPGSREDFVSRFFAPKFGIDEDPVTGSAHCTLAPYWAAKLGKTTLTAKQLSRRTGCLVCRVDGGRVFISGRAVEVLRGEMVFDPAEFVCEQTR